MTKLDPIIAVKDVETSFERYLCVQHDHGKMIIKIKRQKEALIIYDTDLKFASIT